MAADAGVPAGERVFEPNMVFVGNLDYKTTWQRVKDFFRSAGPVRFADLIADPKGRPKGSAIVTFETADGAANAIARFHDADLDGRRILVRSYEAGRRPTVVRGAVGSAPVTHSGGSNHGGGGGGGGGSNHGQISAGFAQPARARDSRDERRKPLSNVQQGGNPQRGGGTHNAHYDDRQVGNNGDMPRPRSQQGRVDGKLFVSNLPFECTAQALRETFSQVGRVVNCTLITSANGRPRGMGLVEFSTAAEAKLAIEEFDRIEMAGRAMSVRFERKQWY